MLEKLTRYSPFLITAAIFSALAVFIAMAPNKPACLTQTEVETESLAESAPNNVVAQPAKKTPTLPIVENPTPDTVTVQLSDLMYGQQVRVNDGARYYESADLSGSGKHGVAGNRYTEISRISGFAAVDFTTGRLLESEAYTRDDAPVGRRAPEFVSNYPAEFIWVAICTDGYEVGDVGWVSVCELNWQDGAVDIAPEAENNLSTAQDAVLCNPQLAVCCVFDEAYAVDQDKARELWRSYGDFISQYHIWATYNIFSCVGTADHSQYYTAHRQPCSSEEFAKYINSWLQDEWFNFLGDTESSAYIWAVDNRETEPELWAHCDLERDGAHFDEILSRPFHGMHAVLIIVTNTHERKLEGLQPFTGFDQVFVIDVSPEYQIDPDFAAQVATLYGEISEITPADDQNYFLTECLEAFS